MASSSSRKHNVSDFPGTKEPQNTGQSQSMPKRNVALAPAQMMANMGGKGEQPDPQVVLQGVLFWPTDPLEDWKLPEGTQSLG